MRAKRLVGLTGLGLALALTGAATSLAAATTAPAIEAPLVAAHGRAIPGQFIVVLNAGDLSFGANVTTQTISVTINGDTKYEINDTFFVNLSGATNG